MSAAPVYRAGVVGAGAGGKLSMKALHASSRYELVAVADLRAAALAEAAESYPGIRTFADHRSLLDAGDVDVLCVATWPPSHLAITLEGLGVGLRGILVEKPLGDTHAAGTGVLEAIRDAGIPAVVPHGLLVADHGRAILERVAAGAIGTLKLIEIECAGWDIINAGIHWLNFALALLPGDPVLQVLAACDVGTRTYRDGMQVETEAVTYATTRAGVRIVMHTGDFVPVAEPGAGTLFRLVGSRGLLEFFGWQPRYRLITPEHPSGELVEVPVGAKSNHERYLDLMAAQMDAGAPDLALLERSLAALEICEAAYRSNHERCAVLLPLGEFLAPPPVEWVAGQPYSGSGGGRDGRRLDEVARN